jgi:hypothetical protein
VEPGDQTLGLTARLGPVQGQSWVVIDCPWPPPLILIAPLLPAHLPPRLGPDPGFQLLSFIPPRNLRNWRRITTHISLTRCSPGHMFEHGGLLRLRSRLWCTLERSNTVTSALHRCDMAISRDLASASAAFLLMQQARTAVLGFAVTCSTPSLPR